MLALKLLPVGFVYAILQVVLRMSDDAELVRRLKSREARAMSVLYDRFGRISYSLIYRMVRDPGVAEDLVQETFLRIWNRVHSFDAERGALGPWVLAVARNRAIDYLRSTDARMQAGLVDLEKLERAAAFNDLDTSALSLDRARRLQSAFQKLTANQKQVIELAYYEGLSQTEMAERLKQPLGTVKTWTRAALKILRDELAEAAIA